MNRKETVKQQPRTAAPNPKGAGRPVQQFASKMNSDDVARIKRWIEEKEDLVDCIYTLVRTRGISSITAYRWYEKVALMLGKQKHLLDSRVT